MSRVALLREMTGMKPLKPNQSLKVGSDGKLMLNTKSAGSIQAEQPVLTEPPIVEPDLDISLLFSQEEQPKEVKKVPIISSVVSKKPLELSKKPKNKHLFKKKKETVDPTES